MDLPTPGKWNVWVRNRDWCQGEWQSPGRFQVLVEDKPLQITFGEAEETWHWQSGGSVEIAKAGKTKVSLRDLTGFDVDVVMQYFLPRNQIRLCRRMI